MTARFIPGIYNHCNAWCARCRYTHRCLVFAEVRHSQAIAEGRPSLAPVEDVGPPGPEAEEFRRELEEAQESLTEADLLDVGREQRAVGARVEGDTISQLAERVSRLLWDWSTGHRDADADLLLLEAREVVGHYGIMLGPKVHRSLRGYYEARLLGDGGLLEADSLGTAKVVLLAIDSLLPAVEALTLAYAGDVSLRIALAELPVLRSMMEARFANARAFRRPIDNSQ
jgi:hypothetical protein